MNYAEIIKAAGAEFVRETGDHVIHFRNDAGVELTIYAECCDVSAVKLRLAMTRKFKATRRDDLSECCRLLKAQIANAWHQLCCHRRDAAERNHPAHVTPEAAELSRAKAALRAVEVLNELDHLRVDLADRERDFEKQPVSFREIHECELQIAETQRDINYFEGILADLRKQERSLQLTSVTSEAIG